MNDWNQDDFLEKLMAPRHDRRGANQDPCSDPESLCAYAEDRIAQDVRGAIAAHLKTCATCAGLLERILDFARPPVAVPEAEWIAAEKRLGNWMDGFLRAAASRPSEAVRPDPVRGLAGRSWLWSGKIQWVLGACAVLAVAATALFYLHPSLPLNYAKIFEARSPAAPPSAQNQSTLPVKSPAASGTPNSATEMARNVVPAPGTSLNARQYVQPPARAPKQVAPGLRAAPTPSVAPNGQLARGLERRAMPTPADTAPPSPNGAAQRAVVLTPEVKQLIAEEVRLQIVAERADSVNSQPTGTADDNQVLGALDSNRRVFIVSRVLSAQATDGQECTLAPGDILTRMDNTPDPDMKVTALVTSSQKDDCAAGSMLAVALDDLQEMHNDFIQKMDAGMQQLAANQGKKDMPASPVAGVRANPDGQADADSDAPAYLALQQREANSAEDEVDQAAAEIAPSAYHRNRIRPGASEFSSSSLEDPAQISRYEDGELTLVARSQGSKQSSPRPQQGAPAARAPAPAPKVSSPPPQRPGTRPAMHTQPNAPTNSPPPRPTTSKPSTGQAASRTNGTRFPQPAAKSRVSPPTASRTKPATPTGSRGTAVKSAPAAHPGAARASSSAGGAKSIRTANGAEARIAANGRMTRLTTKGGTKARFDSQGGIASIHTASGMTIDRSPNGQRRVESVRRDGTRVVNVGNNRGFVERTFPRNGRSFVRRTYWARGHSYAYVYGRSLYRGHYFNSYIPGYYFAPAFYVWAYNPWATPLHWGWGWDAQSWYGYYGYYFSSYPYYPGPTFWLTDYLLAENLRAAFETAPFVTS
jgi:hypothetical protein